MAAGHGWVAVGGSDNGECAFIRLPDYSACTQGSTPAGQPADVDSALPIGFEPSARMSSPRNNGDATRPARDTGGRQVPEMQLHTFGGSIVNSVTIHRLPGGEKDLSHEDVAILRYHRIRHLLSQCCADDLTVTTIKLSPCTPWPGPRF